ncbi:hypothetical protein BC831DRAFT_492368 [Entophlyctis helioformis]|nr:hypothetical protein BC831DRAFT_492368 [Entophlyctis helioformis]
MPGTSADRPLDIPPTVIAIAVQLAAVTCILFLLLANRFRQWPPSYLPRASRSYSPRAPQPAALGVVLVLTELEFARSIVGDGGVGMLARRRLRRSRHRWWPHACVQSADCVGSAWTVTQTMVALTGPIIWIGSAGDAMPISWAPVVSVGVVCVTVWLTAMACVLIAINTVLWSLVVRRVLGTVAGGGPDVPIWLHWWRNWWSSSQSSPSPSPSPHRGSLTPPATPPCALDSDGRQNSPPAGATVLVLATIPAGAQDPPLPLPPPQQSQQQQQTPRYQSLYTYWSSLSQPIRTLLTHYNLLAVIGLVAVILGNLYLLDTTDPVIDYFGELAAHIFMLTCVAWVHVSRGGMQLPVGAGVPWSVTEAASVHGVGIAAAAAAGHGRDRAAAMDATTVLDSSRVGRADGSWWPGRRRGRSREWAAGPSGQQAGPAHDGAGTGSVCDLDGDVEWRDEDGKDYGSGDALAGRHAGSSVWAVSSRTDGAANRVGADSLTTADDRDHDPGLLDRGGGQSAQQPDDDDDDDDDDGRAGDAKGQMRSLDCLTLAAPDTRSAAHPDVATLPSH